jgi:hypothetical protein
MASAGMRGWVRRSCWLVVAVGGLVGASASSAATEQFDCSSSVVRPAAPVAVKTTLRFHFREEYVRLQPEATTEITVPASLPEIAGVLAHASDSEEYRCALLSIARRSGVFLSHMELQSVTRLPTVKIEGEHATVSLVSSWEPWHSGYPEGLVFSVREDTPAKVDVDAEVELDPARLRSVSPPPTRNDGQGHLTWENMPKGGEVVVDVDLDQHLSLMSRIARHDGAWIFLYPLDPFLPMIIVLLLVPWALRGGGSSPPLPAGEARDARRVVRAAASLSLVYFAAYYLIWAGFELPDSDWLVRASRWLPHTPSLIGLGVVIGGGVALSIAARRRKFLRAVGLALVVLGALVASFFELGRSGHYRPRALSELGDFVLLALSLVVAVALYHFATPASRRWRRLLVVVFVVVLAAAGAGVVAEAGTYDPLIADPWQGPIPGRLLAIELPFVVLLTLALVGGLYRAIRAPWRPRSRSRRRRLVPVLAAAGVTLFLVGRWLEASRERFEAAGLSTPFTPLDSYWDSAAYRDLLSYGGVFVGAMLPLTVLVGLTALLGVISTAGRNAESVAIDPSGWLVRALALLYAGFVIGTGGELPSIDVAAPIAFAVGLVLMLYLPRWKQDVESIEGNRDPGAEAEALRGGRAGKELRQRREALHRAYQKGTLERGRYYARDRELAAEIDAQGPAAGVDTARRSLALGPGTTWWENGRIALRWGVRLAIVPVVYYLWVFFSRIGETLGLDSGFRPIGALDGLAGEFALWLVAATVFGVLFARLPGSNGIVKALPLWGVYLVATLTAVVVAHENYDPQWTFRAFELLLFLIALGVAVDWETLRARDGSWRDLLD